MSIRLEGLRKTYAGQTVVADLSLEIGDGEMCVLLGPSGSGKSTVLRMVAGLTGMDAGRVVLHGRDVTALPPQRRDIGFVFQSYALFHHLTVAENVGFALRVRGARRKERERRCDELLELVGLEGLGRRLPRQLSGGQQQRVALARALAADPRVLLLDEPFGALDARIRSELRRSLAAIQQKLSIPTIFVTHDQEEAFELGDRIAVMAQGRLVETGTPRELYLHPRAELVATFLGNTNLLVGESTPRGVRVGPVELSLGSQGPDMTGRVQVLFRPEDVAVEPPATAPTHPVLGSGIVEWTSFAGSLERVRVRIPPLPGVRAIAPTAPFGADYFLVDAQRPPHESRRFPLQRGDSVRVSVRRAHVLEHPGLHFLLVFDGTEESARAMTLGGELARRAHARVTVLVVTPDRQPDRETLNARLGGARELSIRATSEPLGRWLASPGVHDPFDLVIVGVKPEERARAGERILASGTSHVLFVGTSTDVPKQVLLCTALGEPGKHDASFTGRLVRHFPARVTAMTVLPGSPTEIERAHAERFLHASTRTLASLSVPASVKLGQAPVEGAILAGMNDGHDMLAIGAPLARRGVLSLDGVVGRVLERVADRPILVVRSGGTTKEETR